MRENEITDIGVKYIYDMVKFNKSIKMLYLYGNRMTDDGGKRIMKAIKVNNSLTKDTGSKQGVEKLFTLRKKSGQAFSKPVQVPGKVACYKSRMTARCGLVQ